jgi:putative oxidoreductase
MMKKMMTVKYTAGAVNAGMLFLRMGLGILMFHHGFEKITHFNETAQHMPNLLGMGKTINGSLIVFAEFFCSLFLILGLFTRFACIPLIIAMGVALYKVHNMDVFGNGQAPALFLTGYIVLLLIGPGKISVDGLIGI